MRKRAFGRLAAVAAVVLVLLAADTAQAQRRRLFRGRRNGAASTYNAPWYDSSSAWYGFAPADLPPVSPALPAEANHQPAAEADAPGTGTVTFNVRLPAEDAQLWMAGRQVSETGTSRTVSVSLVPLGQRYRYFFKSVYARRGASSPIRARWPVMRATASPLISPCRIRAAPRSRSCPKNCPRRRTLDCRLNLQHSCRGPAVTPVAIGWTSRQVRAWSQRSPKGCSPVGVILNAGRIDTSGHDAARHPDA